MEKKEGAAKAMWLHTYIVSKSRLCQSKTAVLLPIGIIEYASFEDSVEYKEKLTTCGDQDVHFRFALSNPTLEVSAVYVFSS
jgi:hypothetical protein